VRKATLHRLMLGASVTAVFASVIACNVPSSEITQPPTEPTSEPTVAPTEEPTGALPDLAIGYVIFNSNPPGCTTDQTQLEYFLMIGNYGQGDADPFAVEINGERHPVAAGLAAGGTVDIPIDGSEYELSVSIDPDNAIAETDETNNVNADCTPTP
jgi:subtilase family serine protease